MNGGNFMKKLISIFLSVVMILSVTAGLNLPAYANTYQNEKTYKTADFLYEYRVLPDATIEIIYVSDTTETIPTTIDGKTVTSVDILDINTGKIYIPETVTNISKNAFNDSCALTEIIVAANNPKYISIDGVLFSKDKTTLIKYPGGRTSDNYTVPNYVKKIGDYAFAYCKNLNNVVLQNGLEAIGEYGFYRTFTLKKISIPATVKTIGKQAFGYDEWYEAFMHHGKVPDLYYGGAALDWAKLYDGKSENGSDIGFYRLHCKKASRLDNFKFDIDQNKKTINIRGYYGKAKSLVIPSSVSGYKITRIDGLDGEKNTTVKKITIGSNAKTAHAYFFYDFKSLEEIVVSKSNKYLSASSGVLFDKKKTKLLFYPASKSCKTYRIPDSVNVICEGSLTQCKKTTALILPAKLKTIETYALNNKISSFTISNKNKYYSTKDGVLFNKKKTKLVLYPASKKAKTYIIPKSVNTIKGRAFENCKYLTTLKMPKSVKYIEKPYCAFDNCKKLKHVYYSGSKKEWNKIKYHNNKGKAANYYKSKDYRSLQRVMNNAKIHYSARF